MKIRFHFTILVLLLCAQQTFSMYAYTYTTVDACLQGNGTATVYVNGGVAPYTYLWSNSATDATITGLSGGTNLSVWAYDSAGDSAYATAIISWQSGLNPSVMSWAGSQPCEGLCNGEARMIYDGLGGTAPYFATYDGAPMEPITFPFTGLKATNICWNATGEVYVVDALGCSVTWYEPPIPTAIPVISSVTVTGACNGSNGSATSVDNGNPYFGYYNYNFYDSAFNLILANSYNNSIGGLAAGTYYVEMASLSGYTDPYTYTWVATVCYTDTMQFVIPDMGPFCTNFNGTVFHDDNSNCVPESGELKLSNVMLTFSPGSYSAFTDQQGNYALNLPAGTYTVSQSAPYPVGQLCPPVNQSFTVSGGNYSVNFSDTTSTPLDLVSFISATTARPGFDLTYHITASNFSLFNSDACTITLVYDSSLQFISVSPAPDSQSPGEITWSTNSITAALSLEAGVVLHVPSSVPLGTILNASSNVTTVLSENNVLNNGDELATTVIGSFDPNEKEVRAIGNYPGPQITSTEDLDYTIQFQNTGNDTAFNVAIYDTLSSLLDINSVYVTHSTHEYNLIALNGNLVFSFPNILLPDSGTNEPASHGYVDFRISQQAGNLPGSVISNRAAIVFDFNSPVMTNDAVVTICEFDTTAISISVCEGDSAYLGGAWQHDAGTFIDHYSNIYSCDSSVVTGLTLIYVNDSVIVTDNVLTAFQSNENYQWFDCITQQEIPGATDQVFTASQNGSYAVQITTNEGCSKQSDCVDVIGTHTGPGDQNFFSFYPNPASDFLVIHTMAASMEQKILIRNSLNQVVLLRNFSLQEISGSELDVSNLPNGVYTISLMTNEGSSSKCFVKETSHK